MLDYNSPSVGMGLKNFSSLEEARAAVKDFAREYDPKYMSIMEFGPNELKVHAINPEDAAIKFNQPK